MIDLFGHWEDRRFTAIRKKVGTRKFHRLFHMVNAIRQFGNSDVTCSGRWEHFHKFAAKLQYKRTSRRKKNFSREMHEVHLFLRHLDALTDYQERRGCAWFIQLGNKASSAAEDTGSSRLNSPLDPALGFRMLTESKKCFVVDTVGNTWTGSAGCHLSATELKELKTQVELSFENVDDALLFCPDIVLSSSWYEEATGQPNFKIRATSSFHGAPWFDAVRLEVIPDDAGETKPMSDGRLFTMPSKIHGYAQVLGIFTHSMNVNTEQHQNQAGTTSDDRYCDASVFVRWLGGMYEDGDPDANVYEKPIPVSRGIGHMKEIGSPTKNPYQIFQASQKAILAPVWLIPEPGKPGQYFAMKNDDNGSWHQFGDNGKKNAGSGSSSHDIGQETQAHGESGVAGKSSTHSSQYDSSGSEDSEDESRSTRALLQQLREQKSAKRKQPDGEEN